MSCTIDFLLRTATQQLRSITTTPQLDAELLLANSIQKNRSYLIAHPKEKLEPIIETIFQEKIQRRLQGEPIAYIMGEKEFWSLNLKVTPDTLIPRPETELMVELVLKEYPSQEKKILADLGTGCGAIALAIAHERPDWIIYATDKNPAALKIAQKNAAKFNISHIIFLIGTWCHALPPILFDIIVSNPPYIDPVDPCLENLRFEPAAALISENHGLADLKKIIQSAPAYLNNGGLLLLEHGNQQAEKVRKLFQKTGYQAIQSNKDLAGWERITRGNYFAE